MLDIGWTELAVVALVALIVIGPKDLPRVLRTFGRWAGKARAMAREFQGSVDDMIREAELDEVKKDVESTAGFNVAKEIENAIDPGGEMARGLDPLAAPESAAADSSDGEDAGDSAAVDETAAPPSADGETDAPQPPADEPAGTADDEARAAPAEEPPGRAAADEDAAAPART